MAAMLTYAQRQAIILNVQARIAILQSTGDNAAKTIYDPITDRMVPKATYEATHPNTVSKELAHCQANLARHQAILSKMTPPATPKSKAAPAATPASAVAKPITPASTPANPVSLPHVGLTPTK